MASLGASNGSATAGSGKNDRPLWAALLSHLRTHEQAICRQWFEEIEPLGVVGGAFFVRAKSSLHRDYLQKQCASKFNGAAQAVTGHLLMIKFLGPDDEAPAMSQAAKPQAPKASSTIEATNLHSNNAGPGVPANQLPPLSPLPPLPPSASSRFSDRIPLPASPNSSSPKQRPSLVTIEPSRAHAARYESLTVNPDYCFENFVQGPTNRLAYAAAWAVAEKPGRSYNPLFIHGGVGLGKTHLLQAICLKVIETNPGALLYYTSCETFLTQFIEAVGANEMADFRHRFRDVDVLVVDDIHFLTKRDRSQDEFFNTFNSLFQAQKQIILSSDAPPEAIPDLEERLVSRFKWGLVAKIEAPDFETRIVILKSKARLRGIDLPDDVAQYIAQRIDRNIRELEGAIVKLQIHATVDGRNIDLELAREALGDLQATQVGEPTIQHIISVVTDFYGIRLTDLQSKHRQRSIALPRQVCMYLARKCTRHSLEEIGGFFGGRDHTTVMHALKAVEGRRTDDTDFDAIIRSLDDKLRLPRSAS